MKHARCYVPIVITVLLLFWCSALSTNAQAPCPSPTPIHRTANGNIFNEQQEVDLGDAISAQLERDFHVVQDEQLNSYLNQIAQRLLAQMPPSQMKFRVVLVDIPVADAFTMPGGRIYVTRKLVAFVQSEDELAGVLGHELGHALSHQPAASASRLFRQVLGVTQVGDRADVFLKYNQVIENAARKHLHFDPEEKQQEQLVADSYALYAMTRAGFSPDAMVTFWNRLAQTGGKTGNWLTDLFGVTKPSEQRLREMRQYIGALPPGCITAQSTRRPEEFRAWQQAVVAYTFATGKESLPGLLWKRPLSPPLESEITNVKFSPDGKYLLAQDDFSVYVLTRDPLKPLFRIPVDDVEPAGFTPDSQSILIWTHGLHIEKWNIASQKRTDVHEVVMQDPCVQSELSPDGAVLACIQAREGSELSFDLSLRDVASDALVAEKRNFYQPGMTDLIVLLFFAFSHGRVAFFHMEFSPDAHYFAISRNFTELAWDLKTHAPVKISPVVRDLMTGGFVFDGPDRIVGINGLDPKKSGSVQFPSGPAGTAISLYREALTAPTRGDAILVRPAGDYAVGLIDLKTGKGLMGSQVSALDVYDNVYSRPNPDGSIGIFHLASRRLIAATTLQGHWIGRLQAADVSPDLKWFAASASTRGAVWNLTTGDRVFHVRGFGECVFSLQDNLYAGFNAYLKEKRSIGVLNPVNNTVQPGVKLDEDVQIAQLGSYLLYARREKQNWNAPVNLEVHDVATGAVLWVKHFAHGVPKISTPSSGDQMTFLSALSSAEAKEEEKRNPELLTETKGISAKGTASLIQVVNAQDGKMRGEFAVDTGNGSFTVLQALPAGEWVVIADNQNRALIYSLDGKLTGRLFGTRPAVSGVGGTIALESETGTLAIYDLASLTKREELTFGMPVAFYRFVDNGSKLFAVTADQTAYMLSLDQPKTN